MSGLKEELFGIVLDAPEVDDENDDPFWGERPLEMTTAVRSICPPIASDPLDWIQTSVQNIGVVRLTKADLAGTLRRLSLAPNLRSLSLSGWSAEKRILGAEDWTKDPCDGLTIASSLEELNLSDIPLYPLFRSLSGLTELRIRDLQFNLELDALLDFLEQNDSLESAHLTIQFNMPSLRESQRPDRKIKNRLKYLDVSSKCAEDIEALISKIPVQEGADLRVFYENIKTDGRWEDIASLLSEDHLLNLRSPTSMGYCFNYWHKTITKLHGPNGHSIIQRYPNCEAPFIEFPLLPLDKIETFHVIFSGPVSNAILPSSSFPALKALVVQEGESLLELLSEFFSNPSSSPSLESLLFLDCDLDKGFMEELIQFSSNRGEIASMRLRRVVIIHSRVDGEGACFKVIERLRKYVLAVDVRLGKFHQVW